jgi:hypothetical protein
MYVLILTLREINQDSMKKVDTKVILAKDISTVSSTKK